ncbi:MAG: pilus assembly protein TadG-related protein [Pseudomonadota bacterium]|nr:pilus assembly protein TadG-related protein [Pseudomonadota bacterium]
MNAGAGTVVIRTQAGSVGVMFAGSLFVIIAIFGLALDLSRLYHRRGELHSVAAAAALAAARELNGTAAGVTSAAAKARGAAEVMTYDYGSGAIRWLDVAMQFGDAPDTTRWVDLGAAMATPKAWRYVKVDTGKLDANFGTVEMYFIRVVLPALTRETVSTRAIAGRSSTNVVPLALCVMSADAAESRAWPGSPNIKELVEYGFRRGVSYDLMQLNPAGSAGRTFLVDPFAIPGGAATASTATAMIGPSVCTGSVALTHVMGARISLLGDFPLKPFYKQLNSRFDLFYDKSSENYCSPDIAPPDKNIKKYTYNSISWMSTVPEAQSARSVVSTGKLQTIADLVPPASVGNTAPMYGPLWSFARAVPFSAYVPGADEPVAGYAGFTATDWAALYKPGQPAAPAYPSTIPYAANSGNAVFEAPSGPRKGVRNRRVLNVPLLACPAGLTTPGPATVLAIAKFFLTVPATETKLYAEFGGLVSEQAIGGNLELYQ